MADPLTPEQRQQWEEARMDEPTDETPLFRAASFQVICRWEGVEPPSEETVLEALRAK